MNKINQRIELLNNAELEDLYSLPQFTDEEREYYFFLNEQELKLLDQYKKPQTKLYLGFYKIPPKMFPTSFSLIYCLATSSATV